MSALHPPTVGPIPLEPTAIRLALFGMPDSGKSSLLGALAQVAHTQTRTLHGHLSDLSNGLTELRRRLYDDQKNDVPREITPYPVRFIPFGKENTPGQQVVLYDCDGHAVNQLLTKQKNLESSGNSPLVDAIRQADALIMLIDASATYDQLADDFREFVRFMKSLEDHRTHHHAVGGWPIFLVLTKCDLLAKEPISRSMWLARIEAKEREVAAQFKDFLEATDDEAPAEYLAFGSLDVQVRAVGVSRPGLTDADAQPREPFGVAELFHDAIHVGGTYKQRSAQSSQRLAWTVTGAGGLLATMATVAGLLLTTSTTPEPQLALATKVEIVQANEGATATARLAGTAIDRRVRELLELKGHVDFEKLSDVQKNYITLRIEEAQTYIRFRDELHAQPAPSKARTLEELALLEQRLNKLTVPTTYRGEWQQTEAVQLRERMLIAEIPALKEAVGKLTTYFQNLNTRCRTLLNETKELTPEWEQKVQSLLADAEKARPFPKTDPLQGGAYRFDDVALAEADWLKQQTRVVGLRDLATALGLLGDGSKAPFAWNEPPNGANVAELAARRWQLLKTQYPEYASWKLTNLPEAILPEIQRRLRRSLEQGYREGQRLLMDRLKAVSAGRTEVAADWPLVADYLGSPTLNDWKNLLTAMAKLYDPSAEDPVQQTIAFLKRPLFELDAKTITLRIPDSYLVKPAGDFVVLHRPNNGSDTIRHSFKLSSEGRDGQVKLYTFIPVTTGKLSYKPGDALFAELVLKKADRDMKFTWSSSRTMSFQFERLQSLPQLHDIKQSNIEGIPAEGVSISIDGTFPTVPALLPTVRFEKN